MIKIKTEDKEFDFPEGWDEVKFSQYLKLIALEQKRETFISDTLFELKYLEILCNAEEGELDTLTKQDNNETVSIINQNFTPEKLNDNQISQDHFIINGITYAFYTQETLRGITMGEEAYLESLKTSTSMYDTLVKAAAVMIRPAKEITTIEGFKRWKMSRFNTSDIDDRAKLLAENLSTKDLMTMNNFFFSGSNTLTKTLV